MESRINTLKPKGINIMHYNYRKPYTDEPGGAELFGHRDRESESDEIRSQISQ